jgi:hypothetical protein
MSKVNLAKALKLKNSLVRELNRAKEILKRENVRTNKSTSKVDQAAVWALIATKTQELIALKAKITIANVGLYPLLAEMEELKSKITYVQGLPIREGVVNEGYGERVVEVTFTSFLNQEAVDKLVEEAQARIEALQDQVDAYNATTFIEV